MLLARVVYLILNVYALGLIVCTICTWIPHSKSVPLASWLRQWYEPFLEPIRSFIKPIKGGSTSIDFSPAILLIAIMLIRQILVAFLTTPF